MMNYDSLSKRQGHFKNFTGFTPKQFLELVESVKEPWDRLRLLTKKQVFRKRKIGGGRRLKIDKLEDRILVFCVYTKFYPSYVLMEYLFGVDESTICRIVKEISSLLSEKIVIDHDKKRIGTLKELIDAYPELEEIIVDATEQKINKKDNDYYSGKKKSKTIKTQVITDKKGMILFVDDHRKGRVHDYQYFKDSFIPQWLSRIKSNLILIADLGYQGIYTDFPSLCSKIPFKKVGIRKELNELEKEENHRLAKERIVVEHVFCRLKKYMILSNPYRNSLQNYSPIFKSLAYLVNFRMLVNS